MESRAKLLGHSVHQMLIVFPLGLLATALVFDLIHLANGSGMVGVMAFWLIGAGLIGGVMAAPWGTIDWLAIPAGTRAKRVGMVHGLGNVVVLVLFAASWLARRDLPEQPGALAMTLSFVGGGLSLVTAWLGGELVSRLGVGVYPEAGLNASNSLHRHRKARADL